eukprot:3246905-Alexandrium_andersonii.AAC.1
MVRFAPFGGAYVGGGLNFPDPNNVCLPCEYGDLDERVCIEILIARFPELKHFEASDPKFHEDK